MSGADILSFSEQFDRELDDLRQRFNCECTWELLFLAFLRRVARFGYFTLGPITIDARLIEDIVERTVVPTGLGFSHDDFVSFSRLLMQEVRRSDRKRLDELHYLLTFMRCGQGLPGRVFGELRVTPEQIEAYLRETGGGSAATVHDRLMTPEEVADYLRVHVQTVRAWIRSGRLPARRVAGLRALRVRSGDVETLLRPLEEPDD